MTAPESGPDANGLAEAGPLAGVRVIEMAGIGPVPFAVTMLADMGADVIRVDRLPGSQGARVATDHRHSVLSRGRRSIAVDVKDPRGRDLVLQMIERADVLIEGFRPDVMERLGLGPEVCCSRNVSLVYGRMTGWGQTGPYAHMAGHDINYIAVSGALHPMGPAGEPPVPPLNFVGDYGGGGLMLAFGVLCALIERSRSGEGQVIDAAMVDGAAMLTAHLHAMLADGRWEEERGHNRLDGSRPYYSTYRTKDDGFVAVAATEPQFYEELLVRLGLNPEDWPEFDTSRWPALRLKLVDVFATRSRKDWTDTFAGSDGCVTPVLSLREAPKDPHLRDRQTFSVVDGVTQPSPTPRLSRTPGIIRRGPPPVGEGASALLDWGIDERDAAVLTEAGVLYRSEVATPPQRDASRPDKRHRV